MKLSADNVAEQLFGELALKLKATFYVALSAGVDSIVLLHIIRQVQKITGVRVIALHVNHNLQPESALWADHCVKVCKQLDIPMKQASLQLSGNSEAEARSARYDWLGEQLTDRDDVLLTAHHQQDRAETLLFNLMRGSGSAGLSALRKVSPLRKFLLCRPLLSYTKQEILDYAQQHSLTWMEDPSNQQLNYSRNHIRNLIIPHLTDFREDAVRNIARAASNLEQENNLLREVAIGDLVEVREYPHNPLDGSYAICYEDLRHLSLTRQANVVRFWLKSLDLHVPSRRLLDNLLATFESAPTPKSIFQENGFQFRFYRGYMYAMPALRAEQSFSTIDWRNLNQPIDLYKNKIRVDATEKLRSFYQSHKLGSAGQVNLRLAPRAGVANPKALQGHSLNLKKWLQQAGIPPWRRQNLPLLTMSRSNNDVVLCPIDQQVHNDWVYMECPVNGL
jgi:tRNA(Ile)-lysidine synthase